MKKTNYKIQSSQEAGKTIQIFHQTLFDDVRLMLEKMLDRRFGLRLANYQKRKF